MWTSRNKITFVGDINNKITKSKQQQIQQKLFNNNTDLPFKSHIHSVLSNKHAHGLVDRWDFKIQKFPPTA